MDHFTFDGAWWGDVLHNGKYAILMPDHVLTEVGPLYPPTGWRPLYTCLSAGGQIAGQADGAFGTSWYYDGAWHQDPRIAHGNYGCIFGLDEVLYIIEPAPNQTSQGYRYVWPNGTPSGRLWLGDETILANEVSDFTDLSDSQDRSFLIGKGHNYPGVVVFIDGKHRSLFRTDKCDGVRAHRNGTRVSVYFYEVLPGNFFRGHIFLASVDELRALPSYDAPTVQPPKIEVVSFDSVIQAGHSWTTVFKSMDTQFTVWLDEQSHLHYRAVNAAGSDETGKVRQVTIKCPEKKPMPLLGRNWLQCNIGAKDKLDVFTGDYKTNLAGVDVFCLYAQEITEDVSTPQLGPNTYPNHVHAETFCKLKELGIPLAVEMGSVKPYNCDAKNSIADAQKIVQRVADAEGEVAAFNVDEPLTANQWPVSQGGCHLPLEQVADAHANYTHAVHALGPIHVNWLEAWPEVSLTDIQTFFSLLRQRDALPFAFHPDIDWNRAKKEGKDIATFIHEVKKTCDQYGVMFGVFVNSTVSPIDPDKAHADNLITLAKKIYGILPSTAHVHVASWAFRHPPEQGGVQDVPNCFGDYGMLKTFANVKAIFDQTPVTPPQPAEGDDMFSKFVDPLNEGPLTVKEVKASSQADCSLLILADFKGIDQWGNKTSDMTVQKDKVFSQQANGMAGWREPGTDGPWERCKINGNTVTVQVDPQVYISRTFVMVKGL